MAFDVITTAKGAESRADLNGVNASKQSMPWASVSMCVSPSSHLDLQTDVTKRTEDQALHPLCLRRVNRVTKR
jgi:hypothetical protein